VLQPVLQLNVAGLAGIVAPGPEIVYTKVLLSLLLPRPAVVVVNVCELLAVIVELPGVIDAVCAINFAEIKEKSTNRDRVPFKKVKFFMFSNFGTKNRFKRRWTSGYCKDLKTKLYSGDKG